jgi:hypothetical protein
VSLTGVHKQLLDVFLRYYDTASGLRDGTILAERQRLLRDDTALLQQPQIELLLDWELADRTVEMSCQAVGVPDLASLLAAGLIRDVLRLYRHQSGPCRKPRWPLGRHHQRCWIRQDRSVLLPVLARLVMESRSWARSRR